MLYDLLAALWEGPADDFEVARTVQARTGQRFSTEAAERYLRLLAAGGFAKAGADPLSPRYSITAEGSSLLARLAREVDTAEVVRA